MTDKDQKGFTILELLIATTVFSVVLLGALAGFLQIGRIFYKGVSVTNTQDVANQVVQEIAGQLQGAASFTKALPSGFAGPNVLPTTTEQSTSYAYYCVGNNRYTYFINGADVSSSHMVKVSSTPVHTPGGNFGTLKDVLPGGSGCAAPCNDDVVITPICPAGSVRLKDPVELLGDNMRLSAFYIDQAGVDFYTIKVIVAHGDDDLLVNVNDPNTIACRGSSGNDQYCAVARVETAVFRGWNQ
jgi:prepilin-type N-terminal cleavage/methylation domain-containing protein